MKHQFTLDYWQDDGWYVGRLREVPGVFSQGETLNELEDNIQDAYQLVSSEAAQLQRKKKIQSKPVLVTVA